MIHCGGYHEYRGEISSFARGGTQITKDWFMATTLKDQKVTPHA